MTNEVEKIKNHPVENNNSSALPNIFLRSPLFGINMKGQMVENKVLEAQGGRTIHFTGHEFNQSDLKLWIALKKRYLGCTAKRVFIREIDLLKDLGLSTGSTDRKWLKKKMERMAIGRVIVRDYGDLHVEFLKGYAYLESVFSFEWDKNLDKLWNCYSYINLPLRDQLNGYLTQWLYGYLRTNKEINPTKLETYQKWCGSTSPVKRFKEIFFQALDDLKKVGEVRSYKFSRDKLIYIEKPERQKKIKPEIRNAFILGAIRSSRTDIFNSYFNDLNKIEKKIIVDQKTAIQFLQLPQLELEKTLEKLAKKFRTPDLYNSVPRSKMSKNYRI